MSSDGEERSIDSNDQSDIDSESSDDIVQSDDESISGQRLLEDNEEREGWWNAFQTEFGPIVFRDKSISFRSIHTIKADGDLTRQFTESDWQGMGEDLCESRRLGHLELTNCGLSEESIRALFEEGRTYVKSLRILDLGRNPLGRSGLLALLPIVKTIPYEIINGYPGFVSLHLSETNLDDDCAVMLAEALGDIHPYELNLYNNAIGDRGVQSLLSSVNSHPTIKCMNLAKNNIGREGFEAIAQFFSENQTLEDMGVTGATTECVIQMVDSISSQSKLQQLNMNVRDPESGKDVRSLIAPNVRKLVCPFGFEDICNANSSLYWIGEGGDKWCFGDPAIQQAFDINARSQFGTTKTAIVRSKLRNVYLKGDFSIQPFVEMGVELLPHALELVTRTELGVGIDPCERGSGKYHEVANDNLDGIYRLVRNCHVPEVFSFQSPESRIAELEATNTSLKEENEQLLAEIESLRAGSAIVPNKRARPSANEDCGPL